MTKKTCAATEGQSPEAFCESLNKHAVGITAVGCLTPSLCHQCSHAHELSRSPTVPSFLRQRCGLVVTDLAKHRDPTLGRSGENTHGKCSTEEDRFLRPLPPGVTAVPLPTGGNNELYSSGITQQVFRLTVREEADQVLPSR